MFKTGDIVQRTSTKQVYKIDENWSLKGNRYYILVNLKTNRVASVCELKDLRRYFKIYPLSIMPLWKDLL